nr:MFS transporter [Terrimesophilobacter mesophilus]
MIFAVCGAGLAGIVARIPTLRDDLGISIAEMGLLLLGLSVGSVFGLVLSGQIVARFGPRATIVGSLILAALGLVAAGIGSSIAHNYVFVLAALLCFGFGTGTCNVAMNVEGAEVERIVARPIMPLFHASFSAGSVVGAALAAAAAALHIGVAVDFSITALLLASGAVVVAPHLVETQAMTESQRAAAETAHPHPVRAQLSVWLERRTLLIGLVVLTTSFAAGSGNDWLSLAMVDGHDTSNSFAAITYAAFVLAGTAGRLVGVPLLSRFGRVAVLRGSAAVCAAGLLLVIFVPVPAVAFFGAILWGLGGALGFPVGMSAAADDPELAGARISVVATIGYAASLIGPPLIGVIGEAIGILNALLVVLAFALGAALVAGSAREPAGSRGAGGR